MNCVAKNELRPNEVARHELPHPKIKDVIDGCLKFEASERYAFADIEKIMSQILGELEAEREVTLNPLSAGGVGGALPQYQQRTTNTSKTNVEMTLTLTRSVGHKPGNRTLMRVLSKK